MWKPISEHVFPWVPDRLIVLMRAKDDHKLWDVRICQCSGGGLYYPQDETGSTEILALDEMGWEPMLWTECPEQVPDETVYVQPQRPAEEQEEGR